MVAESHEAYRASGGSSGLKGPSVLRMQLQLTVMTRAAAKRIARTGNDHNVLRGAGEGGGGWPFTLGETSRPGKWTFGWCENDAG